jgi:hypothetical protein
VVGLLVTVEQVKKEGKEHQEEKLYLIQAVWGLQVIVRITIG